MRMSLSEILKLSLSDYRINPVLFVPSLIGLTESIIASAILGGEFFPELSQWHVGEVSPFFVYALSAWGIQYLLIGFLVVLGQASMTGSVILKGKTELNDWRVGAKRYSFRVLGLGLVFFIILVVIDRVMPLSNLRSLGGVSAVELVQAGARNLSVTFLYTLVYSVFYVCLGAAIVSDSGSKVALSLGVKAIRQNSVVFVSSVTLFFIVSAILTLSMLITAKTNMFGPQVGSMDYVRTVSVVLQSFFSPLWFLLFFRLCAD